MVSLTLHFSLNLSYSVLEPLDTPEELVRKTAVGVFMDYNRLPDESLNALTNYLRAELLSVAHQIHYLSGHYKGTHQTLVAVIQAKLARAELDDSNARAEAPTVQELAPVASTSTAN